jgi:hypothetical protein
MSSICRDRLGTNTQGKQNSKKERLCVFAGHDEIANGAHGDPGWVSFVLDANKSRFCVLFAFCAFCLCPEPVLGTLYRAILMRKRNQTKAGSFSRFPPGKIIHRLILTSDVFSLVCLCLSVSMCVCVYVCLFMQGTDPSSHGFMGWVLCCPVGELATSCDGFPSTVSAEQRNRSVFACFCVFRLRLSFPGPVLAVLARNHMIDETTCMPTEQKCA